jgi:hypothetical protein
METKKNKDGRFMKFYLRFAVLNGFAVILSTLTPFIKPFFLRNSILIWVSLVYYIVLLLLIFVFFFISMYAIFQVIRNHLKKVFLIIPIINLITVTFSWIMFFFAWKNQLNWYSKFSLIDGILFGLFYILFSRYLLKRKM